MFGNDKDTHSHTHIMYVQIYICDLVKSLRARFAVCNHIKFTARGMLGSYEPPPLSPTNGNNGIKCWVFIKPNSKTVILNPEHLVLIAGNKGVSGAGGTSMAKSKKK